MSSVSFNPSVFGAVRALTPQGVSAQNLLRADAAEVFANEGSISGSAQVADAVPPASETTNAANAEDSPQSQEGDTRSGAESSVDGLSDEERRQVETLQARDREVRAHEQAHLAAAGPYANGGIQYTFERGPDGRLYAVGGEVSVDTSEIPDDPEATLRKAQTLRRAALAPAEPSRQDRAVAAQMSRMATEASQEVAAESRESVAAAIESNAQSNASTDERSVVAREAIAAYSRETESEGGLRISV